MEDSEKVESGVKGYWWRMEVKGLIGGQGKR